MRKPKDRTWRVLNWENEPQVKGDMVSLDCDCGRDALCPAGVLVGAVIIASWGRQLVFDPPIVPPDNFLPTRIQCRACRRIYESYLPMECGPKNFQDSELAKEQETVINEQSENHHTQSL